MPTTLTALFASALHEARSAPSEPIGIQRAAGLLVTAAGARRVEFRVDAGRLVVNGFPLRRGAPGAPLITECLEQHLTRRLALPAGLNATQWTELAQLYASAPGIYPTAEHMRAAITGIVAGATFEHSADRVPDDPGVSESGRGSMRLLALADETPPGDPALVSRETDLSELSAQIDPLIEEAHKAVDRADWLRVAELLIDMEKVAVEGGPATEQIVTRERRRLLPVSAIEHLVGELPTSGASTLVMEALSTLGRDGADALFELLAEQPSRERQRLYLQALESLHGADDAIIAALASDQDDMARSAAIVAGRRRMERAIPVLGALLKHHDAQVRAATWRALEDIGTAEAMRMLG